ncbi:uncharacterized protein CANTADRAFT_52307 [Suhomyces tanzawaensis NRRL Y-17324]|uniref:Uncharacterized protein n=1 Tax=Suhomyces tanzawaensis NRRL Y-17324 TaxID=984487 RepID=A0A1E4SIT4_9ASCO|nr:uncharacterized protein CANTADRAFT_52307 [Suhomyces tanzawaensis NRRL Y-17324]ODV79423.1 hypothetical protein CANTADRAFT_52307 [Suhomyces tanzawaensis NRRL Y-17324]
MSLADAPDLRVNERLHLYPYERLEALSITSGIVGGLAGFYDGLKSSSLRYLTENGHRLPQTVGGWYFYHKKKNYVMIVTGGKTAVHQGLKYSMSVGGFFGLEYLIDTYVRGGTKDFMNTTVAAGLFAGAYGKYYHLSRIQVRNYVRNGTMLGLMLGLAQDMLIYRRGGSVWYVDKMKKMEA